MDEYMVVEAYSKFELEKRVKTAIKGGWTPIGGVSISNSNTHSSLTYVQAMVR